MSSNTSSGGMSAGLLAAFTASLCCITPVFATLAGIGGIAATFSWMEPFRPYLIAITFLILGFAWYQKLKPPSKEDNKCACTEDEKPAFWQSKKFLGAVTALAIILMAFPYYSGAFFPDNNAVKTIIVEEISLVEASLTIEGMTCTGCEHSVNAALSGREGVIEASTSYETGTSSVKFDKTKVSIDELAGAVEKETGYRVTDIKTSQ